MPDERRQQAQQLYEVALELEGDARKAYLDKACGVDVALRIEVESLLGHDAAAKDYLESHAIEFAARAAVDDRSCLVTGQRLGPYRILSFVGRGGMGDVYLAEDGRLGRKVALKLLPSAFTHDEERVRRFQQEARAASMLNHPNILTIFEIGQADAQLFMAAEFVEGESLLQHLARGHMSPTEVLDVGAQVASALTAAHAAGIVHRDLKPDNVMVRPDGLVKVLDFGLAKLTEQHAPPIDTAAVTLAKFDTTPGAVLGTAAYMSPEQARGQEVDARSDIFSLGVVLYEMAAGRRPFEGETASDLIAALLTSDPPPIARYATNVPRRLEHIVGRALRKDRGARYQHVKDLLIDLEDLKQELELAANMERVSKPDSHLALAPGDDESTDQSDPARTRAKRPMARRAAIIVLISTIALVSLIALRFYGAGQPDAGTPIRTIAVLPFAPLDRAAGGDSYLELGMADALITRLSNVRSLVVRPTSAVRRYLDVETDPSAAGRELLVDAVLEGSVQRAGDRIRVTVRLVRVADSAVLWTQQFDEAYTNVFATQDAITSRVASALALRLSAEERVRLARRPTDNTEAYELYLKGRFFEEKRTPADARKAIDYFSQAVEKDPNLAMAYASISDSYAELGLSEALMASEPPREVFPQARAAALRAIDLDPDLADGHKALAQVAYSYEWNWPKAEAEFVRSIEIDPNDARNHHIYALFLASRGRADEAVAEARLAVQLDPVSLIINTNYAYVLYRTRRFDEAIEQCKKTLQLDPNFAQAYHRLGLAYEAKGMFTEAITALERTVALTGGREIPLSALGHAYAIAGRTDDARRVLDQLLELSRRRFVSPYHVAAVYAGLGDNDQAFLWLERAYEERIGAISNLEVNPQFDRLRADARFAAFVRRIGPEQ